MNHAILLEPDLSKSSEYVDFISFSALKFNIPCPTFDLGIKRNQ